MLQQPQCREGICYMLICVCGTLARDLGDHVLVELSRETLIEVLVIPVVLRFTSSGTALGDERPCARCGQQPCVPRRPRPGHHKVHHRKEISMTISRHDND